MRETSQKGADVQRLQRLMVVENSLTTASRISLCSHGYLRSALDQKRSLWVISALGPEVLDPSRPVLPEIVYSQTICLFIHY